LEVLLQKVGENDEMKIKLKSGEREEKDDSEITTRRNSMF